MSEPELIWLATHAQTRKYIVEFGCFHGRSTRALADNNPSNGKIWAVDPWDGAYHIDETNQTVVSTYVMPYFMKNLADHIASGHVIVSRGYSETFYLKQKVDMVFLDGDHRYGTVLKDIDKAIELLQGHGLICGHDYNHPNWPGVKEAVTVKLGQVDICEMIWSKNLKS